MRFFDSDQVRDTVMELEELQQELTMDLMNLVGIVLKREETI